MRHVNLLPAALVVLALGCAGAETGEYPDAVTADPDHYAVEFENDAVRVLRITYGPGERSVMHHHPANCSVTLSSGSWGMTDAEGERTEDMGQLGEAECGDAAVHLPENLASEPSEVILFEFKAGAMAGSDMLPDHPDAVSADPDHYSVEFENDAARLLRISYGPGERSVMHRHPANCSVMLSAGSFLMTDAEGTVTELPASLGDVNCGDADVHLPENAGDAAGEVILLELKGRQSFN